VGTRKVADVNGLMVKEDEDRNADYEVIAIGLKLYYSVRY